MLSYPLKIENICSSLQKSSRVNSGHRTVSEPPWTAFSKSIYLYWFVLWMLDGDILIQFLISTTHAHRSSCRDREAAYGLYISLLQQYDRRESNNSFSSACLCGVICHYKSDEGNRCTWSAALLPSKTPFLESRLLLRTTVFCIQVFKVLFFLYQRFFFLCTLFWCLLRRAAFKHHFSDT